MNDKQKEYALALTIALSARKPTESEIAFIERAKVKTPKLYAFSLNCSHKVKARVNETMLETWKETIKEERKK